jgi:hypothetical protein
MYCSAQLGLGFLLDRTHHYSAVENPADKNLNLIIFVYRNHFKYALGSG